LLALSACSSAGDAAFSSANATSNGGATQSAAGSPGHSGGTGDVPNAVGEGGKAGASTTAGGAYASSGGAAPVTWNSAKSAVLTDAQLTVEYNAWKLQHVETCTNGSSVVVKDPNGADSAVVSEGIGYGLLLSVAMADQALFDGLWKYYQDHEDKNGLMNSATAKCEAPGNTNKNAVTDADLDTAMALVQAASRWPGGTYLMRAQTLAAKIAQFETDMCSGRKVLRPSDAWGGCNDPSDKRINPSYFGPGYYKVFAHYFPEQASTWTALSDGSYQLYALYQARLDNLVPDWSNADGSDDGANYPYADEACRTPFRVAVDYAWTGDARAKTFMQNVSSWVDAHGGLPNAVQSLPSGAENSAFVGSFALAGGYDQGKFDGYTSAWLNAKLDDAPYYQGTLRVLYLLVAAGKFSSTL
jgi:endo-1,4-beta-D-glucanase Y